MAGSATLTIVVSRPTISRLRQQIAEHQHPPAATQPRRGAAVLGFVHVIRCYPRSLGCHSYARERRQRAAARRHGPRPAAAIGACTGGCSATAPARRQARRGGSRARGDQGAGGAQPGRAVERRLWARGDHARAARRRHRRAERRAPDHRGDHGDAGDPGRLLHPGDRRAPGGRRRLRGGQGQPGSLAEPAGGGLGGRRLRADRGGQPGRRRGQPGQRVPVALAPPAAWSRWSGC